MIKGSRGGTPAGDADIAGHAIVMVAAFESARRCRIARRAIDPERRDT